MSIEMYSDAVNPDLFTFAQLEDVIERGRIDHTAAVMEIEGGLDVRRAPLQLIMNNLAGGEFPITLSAITKRLTTAIPALSQLKFGPEKDAKIKDICNDIVKTFEDRRIHL
jgi:hypothetical protein